MSVSDADIVTTAQCLAAAPHHVPHNADRLLCRPRHRDRAH
jgi:hypothetical protein